MAFAAWEIQIGEESPIFALIKQLPSPLHCSAGEGSRRTTQGDDSHPRKCPCEKTDVLHPHQSFSPTGMRCPLDNWLLETSRPFYIFQDKHPDCWTTGGHGRQCSSQPATDWNCKNHDLEAASQPETFGAWQGAFGNRRCVLGLASGGGRAAPSFSPSFGRSVTGTYWLTTDSSEQHSFQTENLFKHLALKWFSLDIPAHPSSGKHLVGAFLTLYF